MTDVLARYGNTLEGGADLTALPCSAKGTFSSSVRRHIENYNLPTPYELNQQMQLGDVTPRFELIPKLIDENLCGMLRDAG